MTIIGCPTCNARNRVGPIAQGVPRCPRCKSTLPWVVDADTGTFTAETTASVPVVVDFWAAWCGPCRMISPVLEDLAKRHAGHLKVVKVDVDANPGLATRFGAQSIPLLVVIRDGQRGRPSCRRASSRCAGAAVAASARRLSVDPGSTFRERGVSPGAELLEPRVNEVRDVIARVAAHPRRLAGDQRMLVGESDSYAGAIGRPDRDDRIVAIAIARLSRSRE